MTVPQKIWAWPQLPSGRRVAIDCYRLRHAVDEADKTGDVNELLKIWRSKEIRSYMEIVEIVERPDLPASELVEVETKSKQPLRGVPVETGYTLEDVLAGKAPWSPEDMDKFRQFAGEIWICSRLALCLMGMRDTLTIILARSPEEQACR
ncbi:MAG: hypothetical protein WEC73_05270 [Chthoniobacterales bacterium]